VVSEIAELIAIVATYRLPLPYHTLYWRGIMVSLISANNGTFL